MNEDIKLEKAIVMFRRKPSKQGKDYYFKIPRNYIRNKLINTEKEYNVYIMEIKK